MSFDLYNDQIILYFLVFCRVGMALMLLPAFSASYINPRTRLFFAVGLSLIIGTAVIPSFEITPPTSPIGLLLAVFAEITIGFMLGAIARIITATIHIAGMIMSMQSAMAQAVLFDPSQGSQGALFGNFMEISAIVLMFALNLHHLLILAIANSYSLYPVAEIPDFAILADAAAILMNKTFTMAFQLASPIIIVGLITNLASGLLARLMPSFQVFFVITPAQIMISFFIFTATFSSMLMWYIHYLETSFVEFL